VETEAAPAYREYPLAAPLSEFVECVWTLRAPRRPAGAPPERIFPDGCVEVIVQLDERARSLRDAGRFELQPSAFLIGPLRGPLLLEPAGPMHSFGIRFRPGRAAPFLPFGVDRLAGAETPVADAFGRDGGQLAEEIGNAPTDALRVEIARAFLLRRLERAVRPPSRPVSAAVRRMIGPTPRRMSVSALARESGWSVRQLERRFRSETGLTPRLLARIVRFQRVFRAVDADGGSDWVSVALDCGYADQPHLIREFREFTGQTPAAFERTAPGLGARFVAPERLERFFAG
jgi:AraC-like DNA-binding protein